MKLTETALVEVLAAIRSPNPTPGGGSASAIAGALGASLLAMVAAMSGHRAASDEDANRLQAAGWLCTEISERLTDLIDQDSEAYDLVVAAYRLPRLSDEERTARSAAIQKALIGAVDAPLPVMRRSAEAVENAAIVAAFGNRNAASDVGVALELLAAAQRGAKLNVDINLVSIKDADYARRVREDANTLAAGCETGITVARARLAET